MINFPRCSVWMYYVIHVGRRQRSALPAKSVLKSGLWRREPLGRYKKHIVSLQAILTVTFALTICKQDILIHTVCNSCFSCTPVCIYNRCFRFWAGGICGTEVSLDCSSLSVTLQFHGWIKLKASMGLKNGGRFAVTNTLVRVKVPALKAGLRLSN